VDGNCTDDKYFDEDYNYMENESYDSVWNFHVWNDVWMARPDLPTGMGGWQALDGTPQETSGGLFRCGPTPVQAVKEGRVDLAHDTRFVFGEVNGDVVSWRRMGNGEWVAFQVDTNTVGIAILTKKPNSNYAENIVGGGGGAAGSMLEKAVQRSVMKKVRNPVIEAQSEDIKFEAEVLYNVGGHEEEIVLNVNAHNNGHRAYTVVTNVIAHVVRYTGVQLKTLEKRTEQKEIRNNGNDNFEFRFPMSEFSEFHDEEVSVRFSVTGRCKETEQVFVTQKTCNIQKSELQVELASGQREVKQGDTIKVKMTIPKPPAGKKYTNAYLLLDTPIPCQLYPLLDIQEYISLLDAEVASGVVEREFKLGAMSRSKVYDFSVTFNSDELSGIHGSMELNYKTEPAAPPPPPTIFSA
jgi:hypothetical protein